MGELFVPTHLIMLVFFGSLVVVPFWQIFRKCGFPPPLSLLMIIPLVNLGLLFVIAFGRGNPPRQSV